MEDLFVNFIGAVVFSVIGYLDAKHPGRKNLAPKLIPYVREDEDGSAKEDAAENGTATVYPGGERCRKSEE